MMVQVGRKDAPHLYEYAGKQYQRLVRFLEEQTGKKLDREKIREIRAHSREVAKLRREINEYRKAVPTPMGAADGYTAMFPGTYLPGTKIADDFYTKLREEVKYRLDNQIGIIPEEKFDDCTYCHNCATIPYTEYESCYYKCKILNRIVGDEGYDSYKGGKGYEGFEPDIPDDCPLLDMN